jgi:hypothetical protein
LAEVLHVLALLVSIASSLNFSLQSLRCADLSLASGYNHCLSFLQNSNSIGTQIIEGALQILLVMQMFVLGPRLILSVRVYHTKLLVESDAETSMASIVFQQRVHVSTSSTV